MGRVIITNNPKVRKTFEEKVKILFVEGGYRDVLVRTRDLMHLGANLLSHPLSGSVKPNETPYKSVLIDVDDSPRKDFGLNSDDSKGISFAEAVEIMEHSIATFDKFASGGRAKYEMASDRVLEDMQLIDLSLISSAME